MYLLASDFDNTLLFNEQMKDDDVKAIHRFQKKGHLFGLCSGRTLEGVLRPSTPYDIHYDFYILLSGAIILNKDREVIFQKKIPLHLVLEIYNDLKQKNTTVVYNDQVYTTYENKNALYKMNCLTSFEELPTDDVDAFSIHYQADDIESASKATQYINDHYGNEIEAYQNNEHIDLAAKGCSKGNGIKIIQDYFQLEDNDIHCIGDSWNDLPMLKAVQHSYTFTYAPKDVQEQAQTIVNTLAECIQDIEKK